MKMKLRLTLLFLADFLVLGIALILFALFHHALPGSVLQSQGETQGANAAFDFPGRFTDGEAVEETTESGYSYRDGSLDLTVTFCEEDGVTYVLADFYLKDLSRFRTAFAGGTFVSGVEDSVLHMASEKGALLAASGDYCGLGNRKNSVVIRNGEVYRKTKAHEVCVLYRNGVMETYRYSEFDTESAIRKGAWQAWDFGPGLLLSDGSARTDFHPGIAGPNPRMLLGYFEPGHYCLVAVNGRQKTSAGLSLEGCARLMERLGCRAAYNLDGGNSAAMVYQGELVNVPSGGGRNISDILYLTKEEGVSE